MLRTFGTLNTPEELADSSVTFSLVFHTHRPWELSSVGPKHLSELASEEIMQIVVLP